MNTFEIVYQYELHTKQKKYFLLLQTKDAPYPVLLPITERHVFWLNDQDEELREITKPEKVRTITIKLPKE